MPRLFTGLEVPATTAQALTMLRGGLPGARWIHAENYHVTLRFIGDIDDALAREIAAALDGIRRQPVDAAFEGLTTFGGRKPRALVAALVQHPALMELQADHERLLQRIGVPADGRKYTPHVTLARLRDTLNRQAAEYLATRSLLHVPPVTADRFVLYSARASTGGGPYVVEAAYPLQARA